MSEIYYYKDKPYSIVCESKIRFSGIRTLIELTGASSIVFEEFDFCWKDEWVEVVIYKTEYPNTDGEIWVRTKLEFYELFKTK